MKYYIATLAPEISISYSVIIWLINSTRQVKILNLGKGDIFGHCLRTGGPIYAMAAAVTGGISGTRYIYIYTWRPKQGCPRRSIWPAEWENCENLVKSKTNQLIPRIRRKRKKRRCFVVFGKRKELHFIIMIKIILILFTFLIIIVTIVIIIGKTWIPVFTVLNFNGLNFDPLRRKGFANFCEAGRTSLIDQSWFCVVRYPVNLYRFPPSWICWDFNPRDLSFFVCLQTSDWDETNLKETVNEIKHSQSCKASSSFASKHKIC